MKKIFQGMDRGIVVAALVGLVLRLAWSVLSYGEPFSDPRASMSKMYVRSAYLLLLGHGYQQVYSGSPAQRHLDELVIQPSLRGVWPPPEAARAVPEEGRYPETLHPPGTSLVAAGMMAVTGWDGWVALQVAGCAADVLGILLVGMLARRVWPNHKGLGPLSSLAYAVFPPLLAAVASARDVAFGPPLFLAAVYAYALHVETRRGIWLVASAVISGLASYFRPDALLLTSFLCLAHVPEVLRRRSLGSFIGCMARPVAALVVALLVLLPWGYRNKVVFDRWIFTSTGSGCTLVTGLGTYPNPWGFGRSDLDRDKEAKQAGFKGAFDPDADPFFRKMFLDAVRSHPGAYAAVLLRRLVMPFAPPYDWGLKLAVGRTWGEMRARGEDPVRSAGYLVRSYWPNLASAAAALAGLIGAIALHIRGRGDAVSGVVLVLPYAYVVATHVFTHMAPYYLLPAVGCQLVGLAYLVTCAASWHGGGRGRPVIGQPGAQRGG